MDLKPIVTCYGDKDVYNQLNPELESRLPREDTEWRSKDTICEALSIFLLHQMQLPAEVGNLMRSYGRPPKTVRLKAHFIRLSEGMLTSSIETASSLHKQPFFHLYWTDCQDADEYKSSVKNSITEWQRKLKVRNIVDWMVIQVVSQDSLKGNKPKIQLPRSTVFDKIKSDFGSKSNDRIIQLWEPSKEGQFTRAVESWQNLVTRLRQLLLMSFNRHLGKFEDRVRLLREKRTEPRWSFTTYFLLHEELSFVFEMLGLFEEALIQYDEIDALLTQLVINSSFGEPLDCIDVFMRDCKCCDGVPLAKAPQQFLRQLIKTQEATYVDLRNYLFARQCNLLLRLGRPSEIAQRTLDFLHNLVHELGMNTLKITMTTGGASCCVILTCLEVLMACENKYAREEIEYSLHFALLYQYARQKLDDVGNLCALMPDMSPSETKLHVVCMLLAGIGKTQGEDTDLDPNSPPKRLQEALSSKRAFQSLYLELTGQAIRIYKNIGRFRASKVLGMDLAQFYVPTQFIFALSSRGEFARAEPYLVDAYKMYKHERWTLLVTQSLMKLAECQKQLKLMDKYASCCSILACEQSLPAEKRFYYTQELLQVMRDTLDSAHAIVLRGEPLLRVEHVHIDLMKGIGSVGERIQVQIRLFSALQEEVTCGRISFSLQTADLKRAGSVRSSTRNRAASPVVVMESSFTSSALSEEDLSDQPPLESQTAEEESATNGDTAEVPHPPIPKKDPSSAGKSTEELHVLADEEFDCCLQCFNVPLKHGVNEYTLTTQLAVPGHYDLKQLCVEIGRLDFVWPQLSLSRSARGFAIVADPPHISWNHDKGLQLLCGLPQQVLLRISVDPGSIAVGSVLEIASCNKGFTFQPIQSGVACIQSSLNTEDTKMSPYNVKVLKSHGDDDITNLSVAIVTLPAVGPYASIDLNLIVQAPLEEQGSQDEATEHTLQFSCKWLSPVETAERSRYFHRPCTVRHVLHSAGTNRFIQVIVTGITSVDIIISSPELIVKNWSAAELTPLHSSKENMIVNKQDISFLWKVECGEGSPSELDCEFKTWFSPKQCPGASLLSLEKSAYLYEFRVENTQTLFTISSRLEPSEGYQELLAGANCKLHITFTRLLQKQKPESSLHDCSQLLYEVESNTNAWVVCGRNSGVVSIAEAAMATSDVTLDVMPLTGGNLALPNIKLMKYIEKEGKPSNAQPTGERSEGKSSSDSLAKEAPVVLPFSCGQVYNRTLAVQVLVLPSNSELIPI